MMPSGERAGGRRPRKETERRAVSPGPRCCRRSALFVLHNEKGSVLHKRLAERMPQGAFSLAPYSKPQRTVPPPPHTHT